MPLNDREKLVVATRAMRFSEKESLEYLAAHDHKISARTYYKTLAHVEAETKKRLYEIAKTQKERHLERIEELALVKKELWRCYHEETTTIFKTRILKEIKEIQAWISAYDESTSGIIEEVIKNFGQDSESQIPSLSTLNGRREKEEDTAKAS